MQDVLNYLRDSQLLCCPITDVIVKKDDGSVVALGIKLSSIQDNAKPALQVHLENSKYIENKAKALKELPLK